MRPMPDAYGDYHNFGRVYMSFQGSGHVYLDFN
jgi:hypothetical protein